MNATLRGILREAGIAVALTTAVGLFAYNLFGPRYTEAMRDAREANERAAWHIEASQAAWAVAEMMAARAEIAVERAEAAEKKAAAARAVAEEKAAEVAALPPAPDTCAKWIEPLTVSRDSALAAADHWQAAYQEQKEATAALQAALDTTRTTDRELRDAASDVVDASETVLKEAGRSFWSRLVPKVQVGAGAQYGMIHRQVDVGPQVQVGWCLVGCK